MGERARTELSKTNPYYISQNRRRELKYFCLQYKEWKRYLEHYHFKYDGNEWADPTGEEAVERTLCEQKIALIERICRETTKEFSYYILLAVTEDLKEKQLITRYGMPFCKNEFQHLRQKFFYLLSQEKHTL